MTTSIVPLGTRAVAGFAAGGAVPVILAIGFVGVAWMITKKLTDSTMSAEVSPNGIKFGVN